MMLRFNLSAHCHYLAFNLNCKQYSQICTFQLCNLKTTLFFHMMGIPPAYIFTSTDYYPISSLHCSLSCCRCLTICHGTNGLPYSRLDRNEDKKFDFYHLQQVKMCSVLTNQATNRSITDSMLANMA